MTQRNKIASGMLAVLVPLLGYLAYNNLRPAATVVATAAGRNFVPLPVENPALRLDLLEQLKSFEYQGSRRNIFSASAPPPPVEQQQAVEAPAFVPPPQNSGPPPLVVPATFFGHVTDTRSGARRAFFSEGDEVYVIGVGEILLSRFRLVQITANTAELEELSSGRRATLTLEEPAGRS
jgi:hypothetical protein